TKIPSTEPNAGSQPGSKTAATVQTADTVLGIIAKTVTVGAGLSALIVWLFSTFYVATLKIHCDKPNELDTVKLSEQKGHESVYHTDELKTAPGRYQIVIETESGKAVRERATVRFNHETVVSYKTPEPTPEPAKKDGKKWWRFWKSGS